MKKMKFLAVIAAVSLVLVGSAFSSKNSSRKLATQTYGIVSDNITGSSHQLVIFDISAAEAMHGDDFSEGCAFGSLDNCKVDVDFADPDVPTRTPLGNFQYSVTLDTNDPDYAVEFDELGDSQFEWVIE